MQRISCLFRMLGRWGFVVLLLGVGCELAEAQGWRQIELVQSEYGVAIAEMVSDSFGNLHIYYIERVSGIPTRYELKLIYVSGNGEVLWGPTTLNAGLTFPTAIGVQVAGDGMTRSWCVWKDSLAGTDHARGMLLAGFNSQNQEMMEPVYLGLDTLPINTISWVFDLTYRPQDQTLHFVDARFYAYYSKFTTDAEVLVWRQPIDTLYITEEAHIATSLSGEVWAVFRNETPNNAEAMFVRFNDDGSMTIQHPFGTGEEHSTAVLAFTIGLDGETHVVAAYDAIAPRYCRMDSLFTVEEWHDLTVERPNASSAIGHNRQSDVLTVWSEHSPLHTEIYASLRESDGSWTMDGEAVGSQLTDLAYLHVAPIGSGDWAVLTSIETSAPHYDLVLFTTDTISTDVSHERQKQRSEVVIYPNPFNSTISIALDVPLHQEVNVALYDLLGREVDVIYRGRMGSSTLSYAAPASLSSGVYFVRAATANSSVMQKVVLLK